MTKHTAAQLKLISEAKRYLPGMIGTSGSLDSMINRAKVNLIKKALRHCQGDITEAANELQVTYHLLVTQIGHLGLIGRDLKPYEKSKEPIPPLRDTLMRFEKKLIERALQTSYGNVRKAADMLQISHGRLITRMKRYQLK